MDKESCLICRVALVVVLVLILAIGLSRLGDGSVSSGVIDIVGVGEELAYGAYEVESFPPWFEDLLFPASDAAEMYASEKDGLFGMTLPGSVDDVFPFVRSCMEDRGWLCVESGLEGCATFLRETGDPSWALISCAPVGDEVSVVVNVKGGA